MSCRNKFITRIIALAVACVIMLAFGSAQSVFADAASDKTIAGLGTGTIANPTKGSWNKVFYGSKGSAIKFNVLSKDTSDFGDANLLLLSEEILEKKACRDDSISKRGWNNSDVRQYLNKYSSGNFLYERFTEAEKDAIHNSSKSSKSSTDGTDLQNQYFCPLNGDKIFFLDAAEIENTTFGFDYYSNPTSTREAKYNGGYEIWWLRSTHNNTDGRGDDLGVAEEDGALGYRGSTYSHGIRPALNVKRSSIVFTSSVSGGYKLTILDNAISTTVEDVTLADDGTTVTVPHTITGDHAGNVNRKTILLTDQTWGDSGWSGGSYTSYLQLNSNNQFTLPTDFDGNIYLIAEQVNDGKSTDYASEPVEIKFYHNVTVEGGTGEGRYPEDSTVAIKANDPEEGMKFKVWTTEDGVEFENVKASETTFTMPKKDVTVKATYEPIVAKIGNTPYGSLADALEAANAGDTIVMVTDSTEDTATINVNKSITIDLNGHTVTKPGEMSVSANTTIKDSSDDKTGVLHFTTGAGNSCGIEVSSYSLTLDSGMIKADTNSAVCLRTNATININADGKVVCDGEGAAIYSNAISDPRAYVRGTVQAKGDAIVLDAGGMIVVYPGATISSETGTALTAQDDSTSILIDQNSASKNPAAISGVIGIKTTGSAKASIEGGVITGSQASVVKGEGYGSFMINGGVYSDDLGNSSEFTRPDGKVLMKGIDSDYTDYYALHKHKFTHHGAVEATCTEDGNIEYWVCDQGTEACGRYYSDENGQTEIESSDITVDALGHDWKDATCTEPQTCNRCGETQGRALGHDWGQATYTWSHDNSSCRGIRICQNDNSHIEQKSVGTTSSQTKDPTCTEKGETTYTAVFSGLFRTQTKTVDNIAALGHNWSEPSYTWSDDNSSVTAKHVCLRDESHKEEETVETTTEVIKPADCENDGQTTYRTKPFTNDAFDEQTKDEVTPALGHDWGEWRESTSGGSIHKERICNRDPSHVEAYDYDPRHTHDPGIVAGKAATCTQSGIKEHYKCKICGELFDDMNCTQPLTEKETIIPAKGHKWDSGKVTTEPTCTGKGVKTYTCENDSTHTKAEDVDALGHDWGDWTKIDDEQHQRVCKNDPSHVEKAAHSWDEGVVTKEPTTEEEGETTFTCTGCGAVKTEPIDKLEPEPEPTPAPEPAKSTVEPVLVAKAVANGKRAATISWNNVKADRYVIYMCKCNANGKKYTFEKVKTVNGKTFKYKRGKLTKKKFYKFYVVAQKKVNGKYKNIAMSMEGHFVTGNVSGKLTNPKALKLNKTAVTLSKGKTAVIKGTVTKAKKGKKLGTNHTNLLRYKSNNTAVATVNTAGKITANSKGKATIYVQTINGIWKTVKVTVK